MLFPTIKSWYAHIDSIPFKNDDRPAYLQLSAMYPLLRSAEVKCNIHEFQKQGKMGLAVAAIRRKGEALGLTEYSGFQFREKVIQPQPEVQL